MELKKVKGFSLVELIIVVGLLGILILAISSAMLMSIISSNRIRTTTKVKQAGNYAIGQLQTMIRNAKSITSCNSSTYTLTLVNPGGGSTVVDTEIVGSNTFIASNSGTYLTPTDVSVSNFILNCQPDEISFDLTDTLSASQARENPTLHFETSVSIRNE